MLRGIGMRTVACRTLVTGLALAGALLVSAPAQAQDAAAQPAAPAAPVLALEGDAAMITVLIKADKAADFEAVLAKLKEALQKSDKPERKQQAAGWTVLKSAATQQVQGNAVYVYQMIINPVVKGTEYDITRLVAEAFPAEVADVFAKYKEAFAGRAISSMTRLMVMGQ